MNATGVSEQWLPSASDQEYDSDVMHRRTEMYEARAEIDRLQSNETTIWRAFWELFGKVIDCEPTAPGVRRLRDTAQGIAKRINGEYR